MNKWFSTDVRATRTPENDGVAVTFYKDTESPRPNNGIILNGDGSTRRIILAPAEILSQRKVNGVWEPEGLGAIRIVDGRLACNIDFFYEFYETRVLDPYTGEWGEVIGSGRY